MVLCRLHTVQIDAFLAKQASDTAERRIRLGTPRLQHGLQRLSTHAHRSMRRQTCYHRTFRVSGGEGISFDHEKCAPMCIGSVLLSANPIQGAHWAGVLGFAHLLLPRQQGPQAPRDDVYLFLVAQVCCLYTICISVVKIVILHALIVHAINSCRDLHVYVATASTSSTAVCWHTSSSSSSGTWLLCSGCGISSSAGGVSTEAKWQQITVAGSGGRGAQHLKRPLHKFSRRADTYHAPRQNN